MSKQRLVSLFKPSLLGAILTGLLVVVAYGGDIQRYAFTCGGDGRKCVGTGIEKPPLYDAFRYCPCWLAWIVIISPLIGANVPFLITTIEGAIISMLYFYFLASIAVFFWKKFRNIQWFDNSPAQVKS